MWNKNKPLAKFPHSSISGESGSGKSPHKAFRAGATSTNTGKMESANAGHLMSLAALQRQDPYINKLLDVTGQVALYNFNAKANEWEKTEIEGTLFVYSRSASPHHGFTIMNRLSTENLVEPINKDLEFQLQDPFLLYRNVNLGIYSIWFYDKRDCQRIAQLMVKIVKQEAEHAQRPSPERADTARTNGASEPRPIDILELLSKAKEEYQRAQAGETDVSTTAEPTVKAVVPPTERIHTTPQADKVRNHRRDELFGSSLPKDPSLPTMPSSNPPLPPTAAASDPSSAYLQTQGYPAANPHLHAPRPQQPAAILPSAFNLRPSPVFQPLSPQADPRCPVSPLGPRQPPPAPPQPQPPGAFLGQEILNSLKPAVNTDIHKPILAPNFLPSSLVPPHSFQEPMGKPLLPHNDAPTLVKPMSVSIKVYCAWSSKK
ncbi:hypothetical protein NQD34_004777 [Periophthalmus magnuspinnatus]|nr:hypothetical protein NQD34_004777 [Periophthalmus magnuspinnatus]